VERVYFNKDVICEAQRCDDYLSISVDMTTDIEQALSERMQ